jgi:SAM-dependent methyltransferase
VSEHDLNDKAARQDELERWASQQAMLDQPAGPVPLRARFTVLVSEARRRRRDRELANGMLDWFADRLLGRGLDTSGRAFFVEHTTGDRKGYAPTAWHVVPRALRYIGVSGRDTFIDFGCGKGRVVHQAARWPFRRVIGVEVSPKLAEVAQAGLAARRHRYRCEHVEIVIADATQYEVPDDLTIGFFYRPFGPESMEAVLRCIVASIERRPRLVRLIYVAPQDGTLAAILATGRFRLVKDQASSVFNRRTDRVAIFESC